MRGSWLLRRLGRMLIRRTAAEFEAENVPGRAVLVQYQAPWPSNHRSGLRWSRQAAGGFNGGKHKLQPLERMPLLTGTSSRGLSRYPSWTDVKHRIEDCVPIYPGG